MQTLRGIFFRGLVTFLPIAITIYILYAGVLIVDNLLGNILRTLFPQTYIPGLGFLLTILIIFIFGLMLNNLLISHFLEGVERKLLGVPLFKAVYSPLRDLMNLFSKKGQAGLKSVVLVDVSGTGVQALGLVTRDTFRDLPEMKENVQGKVAVYIPWSYGIGGLTFLVPRERIQAIDLPVDRALSLAVTAWVKAHEEDAPHA